MNYFSFPPKEGPFQLYRQGQYRMCQRKEVYTCQSSQWLFLLGVGTCKEFRPARYKGPALWKRERGSWGMRGSSVDGILKWWLPTLVTKALSRILQGPSLSPFFLRHRYHIRRKKREQNHRDLFMAVVPPTPPLLFSQLVFICYSVPVSCIANPRHENLLP